uniref:Small integral membrane protein n=1 Tax=Streptomyces sp. NBC_00003 TaxID=2903608 RepID=A0AAU2VDE4_9ACTN
MQGQTDTDTERQAVANRLWQHGLHEDNVRYQQGNLFLVAQSLLAVAYSTISTSGSDTQPARVIAAFGIALTVIWVYVGHRHLRFSAALQRRIKSAVPDYAETSATCPPRGIGTTPVLVYALPSLAAIMWTVLLLIT